MLLRNGRVYEVITPSCTKGGRGGGAGWGGGRVGMTPKGFLSITLLRINKN